MWIRLCRVIQDENGLTPAEKFLLITLMGRMREVKGNGILCWPSQSLIAKDCGMGKSTVVGLSASLVEKGWLLRWDIAQAEGCCRKRGRKHWGYRMGPKLKEIGTIGPVQDSYQSSTGPMTSPVQDSNSIKSNSIKITEKKITGSLTPLSPDSLEDSEAESSSQHSPIPFPEPVIARLAPLTSEAGRSVAVELMAEYESPFKRKQFQFIIDEWDAKHPQAAEK